MGGREVMYANGQSSHDSCWMDEAHCEHALSEGNWKMGPFRYECFTKQSSTMHKTEGEVRQSPAITHTHGKHFKLSVAQAFEARCPLISTALRQNTRPLPYPPPGLRSPQSQGV